MRMPVLDKNFYPMIKALRDFDETVKKSGKSVKVTIVAERSGITGQYRTDPAFFHS